MNKCKGLIRAQIFDSKHPKDIELFFFTTSLERSEADVVDEVCKNLKLGLNSSVGISSEKIQTDNGINFKIKYKGVRNAKSVFPKFLGIAVLSIIKTALCDIGFRLFSTKYNHILNRSTYYFRDVEHFIQLPPDIENRLCYFVNGEQANKSFWLVLKEEDKIVQEVIDNIQTNLAENGYGCEYQVCNENVDFKYFPKEIKFKIKKAKSYFTGNRFQELYISLTLAVLSKYGYWITKERQAKDNRLAVMGKARRTILTEMPPLLTAPLHRTGTVNFSELKNKVTVTYFLSTEERTKQIQLVVFDVLSKIALGKKHNLRVTPSTPNSVSYGNALDYTTTKSVAREMYIDFIGALIKCFQELNFVMLDTETRGHTFAEKPESCKLVLLKQPTSAYKLVVFHGQSGIGIFKVLTYGVDCKRELLEAVSTKISKNVSCQEKVIATDMHHLKVTVKGKASSDISFHFQCLKLLQDILINEGLYFIGTSLSQDSFRFTFQSLGTMQVSDTKLRTEEIKSLMVYVYCLPQKND